MKLKNNEIKEILRKFLAKRKILQALQKEKINNEEAEILARHSEIGRLKKIKEANDVRDFVNKYQKERGKNCFIM